jgi:hypothetical protein
VSARMLMKALAVYHAVALGAVWLIAPRTGLGHDQSAHAVFVARALGTDLVVVAIMNWLLGSQPTGLIRRALWANILLNLVPVVMGTVYVLDGSFGASGWVGVGAHAVPLLVILYYLTAGSATRQPQAERVTRPGASVP